MEKKNKNKGLVIALVLFIVLSIGLGGYICYDKIIVSKDNKNSSSSNISPSTEPKKEEVVEDETLDINSDLVQNLFMTFSISMHRNISVDNLNNNNLAKLRLAYDNLPNYLRDSNHTSCSKLDLSSKTSFCGDFTGLMLDAYANNNYDKLKEEEAKNTTTYIDAKIMERKVRELFGSTYQVKNETFGIDGTITPNCSYMQYNKEQNIYAYFTCEGGGTSSPLSEELTSAKKEDGNLKLISTFKSIEATGNESTSTLTYTFKKDSETNNYVFEKIEESN